LHEALIEPSGYSLEVCNKVTYPQSGRSAAVDLEAGKASFPHPGLFRALIFII
jgi:hypothetical protein